MSLTLALSTDKTGYAPGEAVIVTAEYADPQAAVTVTVTGTVTGQSGETATATASYEVVPAVTAADDHGGTYAVQSNTGGVATLTGVAPATAAAAAPASGYGGTEPDAAQAGNSVTWQGYTWELEDWGTAAGQPKAASAAVTGAGALQLSAGMAGLLYAGAETDSARGDQGITGNPSTWGYGTYQWVIGMDLTTLPPGFCLGLFTFWAASKGGPAGQKEIDIEFYSAGTVAGAPAFAQFGFYQDTAAQVSQGTPAGHTLVPGSQFALPAGTPELTAGFTWLPGSITWTLAAGGTALTALTVTQGEVYSYAQPYGGNVFAGTADIPATGGQQVITNLWCPVGEPAGTPAVHVPLTSFSYTPA